MAPLCHKMLNLLQKKPKQKSVFARCWNTTREISNKGLDLDEIQGDPVTIAKTKVKLAATKVNTPVLTEDVSLCFNAMNGLPGPYM